MQEKNRMISIIINGIAVILIFVIVYCNYNISIRFSTGTLEEGSSFLPYVASNISAFLCSFMLQADDLITIIRRKKTCIIRWEFVILGSITFLLGFVKIWYLLLFPNSVADDLPFNFITATIAVFLVGTIDLVFLFVSGVFFVNAFCWEESSIEKKNRKQIFAIYFLLILLIVIVDYCNVWFFYNKFNSGNGSGSIYMLYFFNIIKVLIYSLLLQGEKFITIFSNRKALLVRWEFITLGIIALLLAVIKIWFALFLHDSSSTMIQSINIIDLWQIAYMFAAGMFFVRAFQIKTNQTIDF